MSESYLQGDTVRITAGPHAGKRGVVLGYQTNGDQNHPNVRVLINGESTPIVVKAEWTAMESSGYRRAVQAFTVHAFAVSAGKWDQFAKYGTFDKEGEVVFDRATLGRMVTNFDGRQNLIGMDYEHQALMAPENGREAPALAFYSSLALVEGGKVVQYASKDGTPQPDAKGLDDGLYGYRSEITPKGAELLPNYKYISPAFSTAAKDEQGKSIGYDLINVAATNTPFLDGMRPIEMRRAMSEPRAAAFDPIIAPRANGPVAMGMAVGEAYMDPQGNNQIEIRRVDPGGAMVKRRQHRGPVGAGGVWENYDQYVTNDQFAQLLRDGWYKRYARAANGAVTMGTVGMGENIRGRSLTTEEAAAYRAWLSAKGKTDSETSFQDWARESGNTALMSATGARRRFSKGAAMNPEEMAKHFGFAPEDDDAAKYKKMYDKCMADGAPVPEAGMMSDTADAKPDDDKQKEMRAELAASKATIKALSDTVETLSKAEGARVAEAAAKRAIEVDALIANAKKFGMDDAGCADLKAFASANLDGATRLVAQLPGAKLMSRMTTGGAPVGGVDGARNMPAAQRGPVSYYGRAFADEAKAYAKKHNVTIAAAQVAVAREKPDLLAEYAAGQ